MKSKLQYLVISLVFIFFTTLEIAGKEFTVKSYRLEDGLPNLRVNNILQDDYGILWFASDHEIFTYDGISWNVKYSSDKTGDPSYRKLIKDEKGNIWALPSNWSDKIVY